MTHMGKHKDIIFGGVVMVAIVAGMIYLISASSNIGAPGAANNSIATGTATSVQSDDWAQGNTNAKVTVIEYADFQCPACAAYYPVVKQLTQDFGTQVKFVYRYFPLQQHQNGRISAHAAEAAGRQGKFWEMHDMLFLHQND